MGRSVEEYTTVAEAMQLIRSRMNAAGRMEVVPTPLSYGRVLSADVVAPEDVPPFPTSHMDGFAVGSRSLRGASGSSPAVLRIVDAAGPGERPSRSLKKGEAVRVATGARLPPGADTVVPVELAKTRGQDLLVGSPQAPGEHVFAAGQDIRRGEEVLHMGNVVRSQDIGTMISLGFLKTAVWSKRRVGVMATGSELTPATRPKSGKVLESHSPIFLSLSQALGCVAVDLGIVGDDPALLTASLRRALSVCDLVVTLGGTSAGKRDYVVDAVSRLRPQALVHGLKLDRGRVTGIACVRGKPILMLPGPIQAATNAFLVLGVPLIEELSGRASAGLAVPCVLDSGWEARRRFSDFLKVFYVKLEGGARAVARPISGETESMKLLAEADGYVVVPEGVSKLAAGDRVSVRFLPGFSMA